MEHLITALGPICIDMMLALVLGKTNHAAVEYWYPVHVLQSHTSIHREERGAMVLRVWHFANVAACCEVQYFQ